MKSAYELAMERLNRTSPSVKLTDEQKRALAEIDSIYTAKIAEREIWLAGQVAKAHAKGDFEEAAQLEAQVARDKRALEAERDDKKEKARGRSPDA